MRAARYTVKHEGSEIFMISQIQKRNIPFEIRLIKVVLKTTLFLLITVIP